MNQTRKKKFTQNDQLDWFNKRINPQLIKCQQMS